MRHTQHTIQFVLLGVMLFVTTQVDASVTLKVTASNPSEFSEQEVAIKSYLPRGIQPEHVINPGGLEVGYDVKQGQCYVYKNVVLQPQTSAIYQIEIDDIWRIDEERLDKFRIYAAELTQKLRGSEYDALSGGLQKQIEQKIDDIVRRQEESLIPAVSPIEHIGAYETNKEILETLKEDISALENMVMALKKQAGRPPKAEKTAPQTPPQYFSGEKTIPKTDRREYQVDQGVRLTGTQSQAAQARRKLSEFGELEGTGCLSREARRYAQEGKLKEDAPTVVLKIGVENPSQTESQAVPLRHFLAHEVMANDVVDAGALKVGYDFEKSLYYVFKEDIRLAPAETKTFDVVLKNKWSLDKIYLLSLKIHADNMVTALKDSKELDAARRMNAQVTTAIDELLQRQSASEFTEDHVAVFREDSQKLSRVEDDIKRMEDLLLTAGVLPGMTVVDKEELCQEMREEKYPEDRDLAGQLEEFTLLAGNIFEGKSPSAAATWKIIYAMIVFLGVLSSSFYVIQVRAHRSTMFDTLTGVFSRAYISERFMEELRIAKNLKTDCTLLILDIDKFKSINDTYGHAVGDVIIKEFVIGVRKGIRATDLLGRFGGDEFLIILPAASKDKARGIAETIARAVERRPVKIGRETFKLTTSIGLATFPEDSGTAEDMFVKADHAMYETKRKGGNGVTAYR